MKSPKKKKVTKQELNRLIKNHNELIKKDLELRKQEKVAKEGYIISLVNVNKVYPNHVQAVFDFSLDIKENEFIVFVGPSGCGKSTTLRMIAGLEDITCGDLYLYGEYSNDLLPSQRDAAMVFQSYALYPSMSVYENLAFSLRVKHKSKQEIEESVLNAAKILEIEDYLDRKPSALSGGQRQRVALGRAIVRNAKIFLMDEPLSNLDAKLRMSMRSEIVKLHKRIGATTIYVTHDQTEAMTMADRIVVMNNGYIQQIGSPKEIFMRPNNLFVATFVGSPTMNILKVTCENDHLMFANGHKIDINKKIKDAIRESYALEENEILKRIDLIKKDIEEREYLLARPKLLKYTDKYYSRRIKLINRSSELQKMLDAELDKEVKDEDKIASLKGIIQENNDDLASLEADYQAFKENEDMILSEEKLNKAMAKDSELMVFNLELEEMNQRLEKLHELLLDNKIQVLFGIRPENITISKKQIAGSFEAEVDFYELLGNVSNVHFYMNDQKVIASLNSTEELTVGEKIYVAFNEERMHLFNALNEKGIYEE